MKNLVTLGVIVVAIMLAAPASQPAQGQSGSDSRGLWQAVSTLEQRVEKLEALKTLESPSYYPDAPVRTAMPSAEVNPPHRMMIFEGVETVEVDPAAQDDLDRLRREAEGFQRKVDGMERNLAQRSGTSSYRGTRTDSSRRDEGVLLADYRRKAGKKWGEVKRLEREMNEPKQFIMGHWEGTIITLQTSRNVTQELNKIDRGDKLTWEGRRVREDRDSQEWVVTRIQRVSDY